MSPPSPKNRKEFYQCLTDTIAIWWEYHKLLLTEPDSIFAAVYNRKCRRWESYNPAQHITTDGWPERVLERYANAVSDTMAASFADFSEILQSNANAVESRVSIARHPFFHPDIQNLFTVTDSAVESFSLANLKRHFLPNEVGAGLTTGSRVTTQMHAILKELCLPRHLLMLSKVHIAHGEAMKRGIGLTVDGFADQPTYELLSAPAVIDEERVRSMGLGHALGCPAGNQTSESVRTFLREVCKVKAPKVMLVDFAAALGADFDEHVGRWYEGLSPNKRTLYVDGRDRRIFEGDVRRMVGRSCPERRH